MMTRLRKFALTALAGVMLAVTSAQVGAPVTETGAPFVWEELGTQVFTGSCAGCHMLNGAGVPGVFPPLNDLRLLDLAGLEGGREVLLGTLLYGLAGEISVGGVTYNGAMPAWGHLSDDEIAAVLNHILTAWSVEADRPEGFALFGPTDVAGMREHGLTAAEVHAMRAEALGEEVSLAEVSDAEVMDDTTGYYLVAQAERGQAAYMEACAHCHGNTLRGGLHSPPLTQLSFFREWGGRTFDTLYSYISTRMPLDNAGRLADSTYVDIAAFWLSVNNYPAGEVALSSDPDQLRQIVIERR